MATFLFVFIHVQVQVLHQFNHNTASDLFSVHFRCGFIQGFILLSFSFSSILSLPFFLFLFNLVEALQVIVKHLMVFTLFQFIPTKNFLATHLPIDCSPNFHSKCAWIGTEANKPPSKHQAFLFKSGVKEFWLTSRRGIPLSVQHRVHKLTLFYLSMGCCMPIVPSVHCFILFRVYSIIFCEFLACHKLLIIPYRTQ